MKIQVAKKAKNGPKWPFILSDSFPIRVYLHKIEHFAIHRVSNVKKFEEMKAGMIYYSITALSTILLGCFDALICKLSNGKVKNIKLI